MGRSRGQIVLVAAFALAIIFVTLALILNTAIFTENLATRQTAETHDALDLQDSVAATGRVILWDTNRNETSYADLNRNYRTRIANYSEAENAHALREGALRSITLERTHNGSRIYQETVANFTSQDGNATWLVAADVGDTRAFKLTVSDAEEDTPLIVNATNETETWELEISHNGTAFEATVTNVSGGTSNMTTSNSPFELSPTNGSFNGEPWPDLKFQDQFSGSYSLWIQNGSNATGTYELIVDKKESDIAWSNSDNPALDPAIYNATLGIDLYREDLSYQTNLTIEPERQFPK